VITYRDDVRPDVEQINAVYRSAPLYRPVVDRDRIQRLYEGSNVVITAWDDDLLVGILRGLTDGNYDGYVCDLAILADYQAKGIGRELLDRAIAPYPDVTWILRAAATAKSYYGHLGWVQADNAWVWRGRRLNEATDWDGPPSPS
jgi:GNAT superfamily N-acetyltransferase